MQKPSPIEDATAGAPCCARPGAWLRYCSIFFLAATILLHASAIRAAAPDQSNFVGRQGTHFVLRGKPFFVAGVNNHYLTFGSDAEVTRVLDDAVAMNANVVRTFIQPVIGSRDGTTNPTIWDFNRKTETSDLTVNGRYMLYFDEKAQHMAVNDGKDGLQRLDFLLAEARKRNMRLIIAFLDFWAYSGGAQQMRSWYGSDDKNGFFFFDPRTKSDYKEWVTTILTRRNTITGIPYKDDPVVFAWELMNEPGAEPESLSHDWIGEMTAYVKSVDPNHLVSSGSANVSNRLSDLEIPTVDFGTWHGYPLYYNLTIDAFNEMIGDFCDMAKTAGKPVLMEEFGLARDKQGVLDIVRRWLRDVLAAIGLAKPPIRQSEVYKYWLETIADHPDCAGWLVWRLVSTQDSGDFPGDEHDRFDIRRDEGTTWNALKDAAKAMRAKTVARP